MSTNIQVKIIILILKKGEKDNNKTSKLNKNKNEEKNKDSQNLNNSKIINQSSISYQGLICLDKDKDPFENIS